VGIQESGGLAGLAGRELTPDAALTVSAHLWALWGELQPVTERAYEHALAVGQVAPHTLQARLAYDAARQLSAMCGTLRAMAEAAESVVKVAP